MKTRAVILLILFTILFFPSLSLAVEKVQIKPGLSQTEAYTGNPSRIARSGRG